MTFGNFGSGPNGFFPIFLSRRDSDDYGSKLYHDSYDVYVNNDYVGRKTLMAQTENARDIEKHLKAEGFQNFRTSLQGNQVMIDSSVDEAVDIKRNLHVYLNIR